MHAPKRCYRYRDSCGYFYFHDPIMNTATWVRPVGYVVYDGLTSKPIEDDAIHVSTASYSSETGPIAKNKGEMATSLSSPSVLSVFQTDESSESWSSSAHLSARTPRSIGVRKIKFSRRGRRGTLNDLVETTSGTVSSPLESDFDRHYVMDGLYTDRETFDCNSSLEQYLKLRKRGTFGRKRRVRPTEALAFSSSEADIPLLKVNEKGTSEKKATALWHLIREYVQSKSNEINKIVAHIASTQSLIDEAFLQCCKLLRGNPYQEMVCRCTELLLALATMFSSSPEFDKFVRHNLAVKACDPNLIVATRANIAYMRFRSRHPDVQPPFEWIDRMIEDPQYMACLFGSSLEEQMWLQRTTAHTCPIPIFLPIVCRRIVELRGREKQGLFKGGVYKPEIDALVEKVRRKEDPLVGAPVEDLVLFLKRWIMELGRPIVHASFYKSFGENDVEIIKWADTLPNLSRRTLMYLIGFIRFIGKQDFETEMGKKLVSTIMGPVIMPAQESFDIKRTTEMGKKMVLALVESWDVREMYPLPDEFRIPDTLFP